MDVSRRDVGIVDVLCLRGSSESVPDSVTSSESDPLWNWSVLLLGSRELNLCAERLVTLYCILSAVVQVRNSNCPSQYQSPPCHHTNSPDISRTQ
jgi:hypothetical protein